MSLFHIFKTNLNIKNNLDRGISITLLSKYIILMSVSVTIHFIHTLLNSLIIRTQF